MSEFDEVERDEIAVQFVRAEDGIPGIRQAWDALEAVVDLNLAPLADVEPPRGYGRD